jgi:hypothetical protein
MEEAGPNRRFVLHAERGPEAMRRRRTFFSWNRVRDTERGPEAMRRRRTFFSWNRVRDRRAGQYPFCCLLARRRTTVGMSRPY